MNKIIKDQLNKTHLNLPPYDDNTTHMIIPKGSMSVVKASYEVGKEYTIEVEDYIIHPYPSFTLHINWNNGVVPTDSKMRITVLQLMGKMIKIRGIGITDNSVWEGWIPLKSIKENIT